MPVSRRVRRASIALIAGLVVSTAAAAPRRLVTVKELFELNHRIEIKVGTEVVWADPQFDRVWFPPGSCPELRRTTDGLTGVFGTPGTYQGRFTVVAGHGTADVYPLTVVVHDARR